jgi:mono/diheme cytochrome c family protein
MPVRLKKRLLLFTLWSLVVAVALIAPRSTDGWQSTSRPASSELAARAKAVFEQRCFRCHGQNGKAVRNIFVLDRARLISSGFVVPGDAASMLLRVVESGAMPQGGPELSASEKSALRDWVLNGAPDWNADNSRLNSRAFLAEPALLSLIREDLERTASRTRPYIRYFSLAHLHNAGATNEELESQRTALAKLINSLSWHREITPPAPIDATRTVFRIDLRDYLWTAATWRKLLAVYPYALITPEAERIARLSGELVPYMRADWFVAAASVPPLYHELLGLPHTILELERRLGVDTARHLAEEKNVMRAGLRSSGVSQNNRVLERHTSPFGSYWRSYDFRGNLGDQNIFANPLRLNSAGSEIIFNLPNGLQAYFLADAQGRRIDAAPVEIVANRNQPDDPVIRNGRSCIGCHFTGMKSFQDDVRPALQKLGFAQYDLDRALALYVSQDALDRAVAEDEDRFLRAEEKLGGKYRDNRRDRNAHEEPINALSHRFQSELPVSLAAAEVGLEPRDFEERIRWNARLNAIGLQQLMVQGGALKRDVWEKHFSDVVRELQLGVYLPGQQVAASADLIRAGADPTLFTSRRFVQNAPTRALVNKSSIENNSNELLRGARSVFITSRTVYLRPELLENALRKRTDFQSLDVAIVKDRDAADLVIELNRPLFTFDFTYSASHRQSSVLVASGKVVAFDGNGAAPKIAAELIRQMQLARAQR